VKNPLTEIYNNHDQLTNYKVKWMVSRVLVVSTWKFCATNLQFHQVVLDLGNGVFSPFAQVKCPALEAEFSDLPSELIIEIFFRIERKRDLLNVSLTCKALSELAEPIIHPQYKNTHAYSDAALFRSFLRRTLLHMSN